jgi:MFS family permease
MFSQVARIHDKPAVRLILIVVGLAVTAVLLWPAIFFTALSFEHLRDAPIRDLAWTFTLGLGTLVALLAAWVRVAVKNEFLQRSRRAFAFTVGGLILGVGIGALILGGWTGTPLDDSLFWAFFAVTLVGCLLLVATIGARQLPPNSTPHPDAREASRPAKDSAARAGGRER